MESFYQSVTAGMICRGRNVLYTKLTNSVNNVDWNCGPLSVVITAGYPKIEIQLLKMALATTSAVVVDSGTATDHRLKRSTIVKMYSHPLTWSRGPTRSTWICVKRLSGAVKVDGGALVCRLIFVAWQRWHVRDHCFTSVAIPGQTNQSDMVRSVAFAPGWAGEWKWLKIVLLIDGGR